MKHPIWKLCALVAVVPLACGDRFLGDDEQSSTEICAPMRAVGDGQCDRGLGVVWTGTACEGIAGCECLGEDCGELYANTDDCIAAHVGTGCEGTACNSLDDPTPCGPGLICLAPNYGCGAGVCSDPSEAECAATGPVCGCDGATYDDMCTANDGGVTVNYFEACN